MMTQKFHLTNLGENILMENKYTTYEKVTKTTKVTKTYLGPCQTSLLSVDS